MTTPEQQGIYIRPQQMWDKLCKVEEAVTGLASTVKTTLKGHGEQLDDHEQRLRVLEETRWRAAGAGAVLGAAVGVAVQFLAR